MTPMVLAALTVAVFAALRSLWSPCSLSMLSTLTPAAERARGNRYPPTVAWFLAGAVAGGAALGTFAAGLAWLAGLWLPATAGWWGVALIAIVCTASDLRLFGRHLPLIPRQVDETWLVRYRRWIYASGFGVQIGAGLATYVMTSAVYLCLGLAVLTADPLAALMVCLAFAVVRGLSVLIGLRAKDFAATQRIHRILADRELLSRKVIVAVQGAVATGALAAAVGAVPAVATVAVIAGAAVGSAIMAIRRTNTSASGPVPVTGQQIPTASGPPAV